MNSKDIQKIMDEYGLGKVISFVQNKKGFQNLSFFVTTEKGKFVLRISKHSLKKEKDILFEIRLLNQLKGLPVPQYVKDNKGKYVNKHKGNNYAIYRYIEGNMPSRHSDSLLKQTAVFLARFHLKTESTWTDTDRFAFYDFTEEELIEKAEFIMKNRPDYTRDVLYMVKVISNPLPKDLPTGPNHCDIKRENLLITNNKLSGVVDFDNCQIAPYISDVAKTIMWFCIDKDGLNYKKIYRFLKKYESIRKLTPKERTCLFHAVQYAFVSHWFVDHYLCIKNIVPQDYLDFGRRYILSAVRRLNKNKFNRYVISDQAWLYNLI